MGIARGWEKRVVRTNITYAKRTVRIFSVFPQSRSVFSASYTQVFWHQSEARMAATVWNWSGKTLSPGALLAVLYFSSRLIPPPPPPRLDFPSPPLSAHGSPRMRPRRLFRKLIPKLASMPAKKQAIKLFS